LNKIAVERWLRRLVKHFCSNRTMCIMTDAYTKRLNAVCPLFDFCTDRIKHKGEK